MDSQLLSINVVLFTFQEMPFDPLEYLPFEETVSEIYLDELIRALSRSLWISNSDDRLLSRYGLIVHFFPDPNVVNQWD